LKKQRADNHHQSEELNSRLSELLDRERELMIADIQAVREGTGAGEIHGELAEVRRKLSSLKRTITRAENRAGKAHMAATIAFNVSKATRDHLEALAASKARTLSEYMRFLIDEHMAAQAVDFSSGLRPLENGGKVD
jgi:predicted DNA-binding protein